LRLEKYSLMRHGRIPFGILSILLVLLVNLLAAAPELHHLVHADASHADHQCAVTLFAHGQMDSASTSVPVTAPQFFATVSQQIEASVFRPAIEHLPAGRAPPIFSASA
jgi:hypothetical protein